MTTITPDALSAQLREHPDSVFLLDVREEDAFQDWHIAGSHNTPIYHDLKEGRENEALEALGELPRDKDIVTVCGAGITSEMLTTLLQENGYDNVKTLEDGLRGWAQVYQPYILRDTGNKLDIQFVRPGTGCLSYLIADTETGEAAIIDPGQHIDTYQDAAEEHGLTITAVLDTHVHADHISGAPALAAAENVPYYTADAVQKVDSHQSLSDGDTVKIGNRALRTIHVPGHTPGSMAYNIENLAVLTGDTLFIDGVGRPDLGDDTSSAAQAEKLSNSLQQLKQLSEDIQVLPAHFSDEEIRPVAASLGTVKEQNDVFSIAERDEFVATMIERTPETPPGNYTTIKTVNHGEASISPGKAKELELGPNRCASG